MKPPLVAVGLFTIGFAVYTASDPMSRSKNWVDGREWERDPAAAKRKQIDQTYFFAAGLVLLGLVLTAAGFLLE